MRVDHVQQSIHAEECMHAIAGNVRVGGHTYQVFKDQRKCFSCVYNVMERDNICVL